MNTAQKISEMFGDDGQCFTDDEGNDLHNVCIKHGADVICSERVGRNKYGEIIYQETYSGNCFRGNPVRYVFPDGSVIVICGDAWDFEGDEPFLWENR